MYRYVDRHKASYTYAVSGTKCMHLSPCFSVTGQTGQCVSTSTENISITVGTHIHMYVRRREGGRELKLSGSLNEIRTVASQVCMLCALTGA